MKSIVAFFLIAASIFNLEAQTLNDYVNEAKKNFAASQNKLPNYTNNHTTSVQFGYFINPQYTISGAQRAYAELQQEIPWLGKGNNYRKIQKSRASQTALRKQFEINELAFKVKECYYRMYQYQKQKEAYVNWAEEIRQHIASTQKLDSTSIDVALKYFENEALLIETTKQLQIVDGEYQNRVIVFNELLKSETLDEPKLPLFLAMPEEESEFQFPDPFESATYLSFENEILSQKHLNAIQNPWTPSVSLGLRYINTVATDNIAFNLPNRDIIEPQLKLQWNLFSKKQPKLSEEQTNQSLDHKLSVLSHQLQTAINDQISARIAFDAATQKIDILKKLENKLKSTQITISTEKALQINSLKHTFEVEQIKAVADYYISTSKMLLFF